MASEKSFWQRIGLHEWFLKDEEHQLEAVPGLTPNRIYQYIIEKFRESLKDLSFGDRVVFYHEYIICFSTEDYQQFMQTKKGLFGLIAHESVQVFYDVLAEYKNMGKSVTPSSNKWAFRFVSHPDYSPGDIGFIGKLLPDAALQNEENLRVTYIPRQTGIAETRDVNHDLLAGFNFYSEGYYEIPYYSNGPDKVESQIDTQGKTTSAVLETILPDKRFAGKKLKYYIADEQVTVSGSEGQDSAPATFNIPSEWVNTPHLKIKRDSSSGKFFIASFGEKTVVNEEEIAKSELTEPQWVELPINSHIVLNGIVGINIFRA
ncbi:MAG: hypothetical protein K0R82_2524 [Flavipsychrobacter sp.]|jgi:hypothetical protein|nr:hypothetical protein [Flavipsychrobacter sp.]